jgi:dynein heavy chain
MDTGLAKLEEASCSVEILKKDLVVMELELAQASEKAENVCFTELYFPCVCS